VKIKSFTFDVVKPHSSVEKCGFSKNSSLPFTLAQSIALGFVVIKLFTVIPQTRPIVEYPFSIE
jgi:hypothetical protein